MQVFSVYFTNEDKEEIEVSSDLGDFYLPWPCRTWHREAILAWLDKGNTIRMHREHDDPSVLRRSLMREVYAYAAKLLNEFAADYSMAEQIAWPELEREARQFLLDGAIGRLMKAQMSTGGRSAEELAYAIIHKANRLTKFRGAVIAARSRHVLEINAATIEQLENCDCTIYWPALPLE
jgi:hypothetical protein